MFLIHTVRGGCWHGQGQGHRGPLWWTCWSSGISLQETIWSWITYEMAKGDCEGRLRKSGPLAVERTCREHTVLGQNSQKEYHKNSCYGESRKHFPWDQSPRQRRMLAKEAVCVLDPVYSWLALWQWAPRLTFQCFCFLIYKMETNSHPATAFDLIGA